jgi:hypothetical protein
VVLALLADEHELEALAASADPWAALAVARDTGRLLHHRGLELLL